MIVISAIVPKYVLPITNKLEHLPFTGVKKIENICLTIGNVMIMLEVLDNKIFFTWCQFIVKCNNYDSIIDFVCIK